MGIPGRIATFPSRGMARREWGGDRLPAATRRGGRGHDLTNNDANGVATIVGASELQTSHLDGQIGGGWQPHPGEWPRGRGSRGCGLRTRLRHQRSGRRVRRSFGSRGPPKANSAVRAWNGGSLVILGQLNQRQPDDVNCAVSINDAGQAVGWDYSARPPTTASCGPPMARPRSW